MLHHLVINYYLFHFNRELGLNVGYCINNQISHITQPISAPLKLHPTKAAALLWSNCP